jgi:hypothetical protein
MGLAQGLPGNGGKVDRRLADERRPSRNAQRLRAAQCRLDWCDDLKRGHAQPAVCENVSAALLPAVAAMRASKVRVLGLTAADAIRRVPTAASVLRRVERSWHIDVRIGLAFTACSSQRIAAVTSYGGHALAHRKDNSNRKPSLNRGPRAFRPQGMFWSAVSLGSCCGNLGFAPIQRPHHADEQSAVRV